MKRSDNLSWAQVKTGIFILIATLLFCGGVLMMGDKTKMFIAKGTLAVIMPDVAGLKVGAPVWLAGVDVGLVTNIGFATPEKNNEITVTLQIDKDALKKINSDSKITIKTRGLMGEKYVDITPSRSFSETPPDVIQGESVARLDDVMVKAGASFDRLNRVMEKVEQGEGTLGKLMTDKKLYDNLATLSMELKVLADTINRGEGSLGKLMRSDEPYKKIIAILNRADATLTDIQSADGTLGKLVRDRELYDKMVKLADKSSLAADDMRELKKILTSNENTIGKLLTDKELYDKGIALVARADSAVKAYENAADKLKTKDGTAGKLLNDREAYDKLVVMIENIDALIKDVKANPGKYVKLSIF
ncbi:MAG: MCE family protein [Deltaproteobacteria bacterium HGW-Deltaproteobacteria-23]|nr:MAG: MCE family protein [Deltaproteobacteria bacterium HGW-Deltaproteobacteria-23]